MDQLESEKAALGEADSPSVQVENYAHSLFEKADDADRAGERGLQTAKTFKASANIFEACKQFGELPSDLLEKIKYAKWRFVELCKAAKERRPPAPPRTLDGEDADGAPPSGGAGGSSSDLPPPPDYFGLPPPPPEGVPTPPVPQVGSGGHSFGQLPQPPSMMPPNVPAPSMHVPGTPMMAQVPPLNPSRPQVMEAIKLCNQAASSLQFQEFETAYLTLQQALTVLTTQAPTPPS
jgi:hypothetical protein